jgi:hypothetical protein
MLDHLILAGARWRSVRVSRKNIGRFLQNGPQNAKTVSGSRHTGDMQKDFIDEAIVWAEKAAADLEPDLMTAEDARDRLARSSRLKKIASYCETVLARKVANAEELARTTGTSVGKAKATVETARALKDAEIVQAAFAGGDISFDQAAEIAKAEVASPGSAEELLKTAATESFQVLRESARKVVLEAEQHRNLGQRQKEARSARSFTDELGMTNIHIRLQPHVGTPLVNRAEAEAARLFKQAKKDGKKEPFERHLADAFTKIFSGSSVKPHSSRPEMFILVSHEVVKRGWKDVRDGEHCKIPGVGPVPVEVAEEIAGDAFLTGLFYDGKDLRHIKSYTRNVPVEVQRALHLGRPPDFDGVKCVDCGKRFGNQKDHVEPYCGDNPASVRCTGSKAGRPHRYAGCLGGSASRSPRKHFRHTLAIT